MSQDNNLSEKELAHLALVNQLFVDGWRMKSLYDEIISGSEKLGIHLVLDKNIPVASCVIDLEEGIMNVFVNDTYRGKKYGQKVVSEALEKYSKTVKDVYGVEGIEGSEKFYNSCGIAYFKNDSFAMSIEELEKVVKGEIGLKEIRQKRIEEYLDKLNKKIDVKTKNKM